MALGIVIAEGVSMDADASYTRIRTASVSGQGPISNYDAYSVINRISIASGQVMPYFMIIRLVCDGWIKLLVLLSTERCRTANGT
jgi:hypothetical protein